MAAVPVHEEGRDLVHEVGHHDPAEDDLLLGQGEPRRTVGSTAAAAWRTEGCTGPAAASMHGIVAGSEHSLLGPWEAGVVHHHHHHSDPGARLHSYPGPGNLPENMTIDQSMVSTNLTFHLSHQKPRTVL